MTLFAIYVIMSILVSYIFYLRNEENTLALLLFAGIVWPLTLLLIFIGCIMYEED